jgi:hypothetical protein
MDDFLAPNTSNNNTRIKGPDVILRAEAAQTTASVLHELTTKAAKYGALTKREGQVAVRWHFAPNGHVLGPLTIKWSETGGPPVGVPSNSGYGRSAIPELVPYELGGTAHLLFSPEASGAGWIFPPNGSRRRRTAASAGPRRDKARTAKNWSPKCHPCRFALRSPEVTAAPRAGGSCGTRACMRRSVALRYVIRRKCRQWMRACPNWVTSSGK